ncbi:MAG: endonuclease III domain-containing protein [Rhodopila sp.]
MTLAEVRGFIEALADYNPSPQTELSFISPFTLLVAVVLSAQATDVSVNRATVTLFADAPTPAAMVALGVEGVGAHIRRINLWQTKARNVVLNVAFGQDTMAVDTHIFRLGNRTGLAPGKTPRDVEDALVKRLPPERLRDSHHGLVLHGRYVCKARQPECWRCVAARWCRYPDKTPAPASAKPFQAT